MARKYDFSVEQDTYELDAYEFAPQSRQRQRATETGATRAFRWTFQPLPERLPKYVREAVASSGYRLVYLGGTTYQYSVFGLVPERQP